MPVTMIDTIGADAFNIPASAPKVAGYVTGSAEIEWTTADWARFPKAGKVRINQRATADPNPKVGDVYDVEAGALTVPAAVTAAKARKAIGWTTAVYVSDSGVDDLVTALGEARLTNSGVELWVANWALNHAEATALIGTYVRGFKIVAVQWASPTSNPDTIVPGSKLTLAQANADLSVTLASWFAYVPPAVAAVAAVAPDPRQSK